MSLHEEQAHLRRLAHFLDSAIPLPGGLRIGLDGLIGVVPGVGDLVGSALSSYIIAQAYRLGASRSVILRMTANVALETVLGVIPVLGDLFDFAWKANRRNVALLERHLTEPQRTRRRSTGVVAALVLGLTAFAVLVIVAMVALVRLVWNALAA
jgi:hypothetical protein